MKHLATQATTQIRDKSRKALLRQKTVQSRQPWVAYYYCDASDHRVEIPLAPDLVEALRKWAELEVKPASRRWSK